MPEDVKTYTQADLDSALSNLKTELSTKWEADHKIALEKASLDATKAERDRVSEILETCQLSGKTDLALDLVCDGSSPDLARKVILSALADEAKTTEVRSIVSQEKLKEPNALVENAKKRAAQAKQ